MAASKEIILKTPGGDDSTLHIDVPIDLTARERRPVTISPNRLSWPIVIEKGGMTLFGKRYERDIRLVIRDLYIPNPIVADVENMFSFHIDGYKYEHITDKSFTLVKLEHKETDFFFEFHPDSIIDCREPQQIPTKKYTISFRIEILDAKNKLSDSHDVCLDIDFAEIAVKPVVRFERTNPIHTLFTNRLGIERIANMIIEYPKTVQHAPAINCQVTVELCSENPEAKRPMAMYVDFDSVKGTPIKLAADNKNKFRIDNLGHGQRTEIPIFANYPIIGNPRRTLRITANASGYSSTVINEDANEVIEAGGELAELVTNKAQPELEVSLNIEGTPTILVSGGKNTLPVNNYVPRHSNQVTSFPITLKNHATEGVTGAGIVIRNLNYKVSVPDNVTFIGTDPRHTDLEYNLRRLIVLDNCTPWKEINLFNQDRAPKVIRLTFCNSAVSELYCTKDNGERNYKVKIAVELSFDYCLNRLGSDELRDQDFEHFTHKIVIPVFQKPDPVWLAVDFGTSAIVTQYGDQFIDLHKEKDKYNTAGDPDSYEEGTPFLSSNLLLRTIPETEEGAAATTHLATQMPKPQPADYEKSILCLSPTSTYEMANISHVLPCLKLIMGYELIPNIEQYADVRYNFIDKESNTLQVGKSLMEEIENQHGIPVQIPTPMARVDSIFAEVYKGLFAFFMRDAIKYEKHRINQLVLTVPNTFSPSHLDRIESIVRETLSDVNIRNIRFVSESDAVACFYQQNWTAINSRIITDGRKRSNDDALKSKETVLVFDMGAGTLDLTLFRKNCSLYGTVIEVLGRIGIAKAGNYLDCLLAQILSDMPGLESLKNFAYPENITTGDRMKAAIMLKSIIKNHIKPLLSQPDATYRFYDPSLGVKIPVNINIAKNIRTHKKYQEFINQVTHRLLNNFFKFFFADSTNKEPKIDTILLSGRSTKLSDIRSGIEGWIEREKAKALDTDKTQNPSRVSEKINIVEIASLTGASGGDRSKTVVVEGAMVCAQSFTGDSKRQFICNNLFANYGVIYKDMYGATRYRELLNPRKDVPTNRSTRANELASKDPSRIINTYESKVQTLDISAHPHLQLVQTFSHNTAEDWESGLCEYITLISDIDLRGIPGLDNAKVQLFVDENNSMTLKVNHQECQNLSPTKIDIHSQSNKLSLWPMATVKN